MAQSIIMPKTGMAMEFGVIVSWFIKEGQEIQTGDVVAEIETDKTAMEIESDCDGTVLKILYEPGTEVPVTKPIAWIGKPGEVINNADGNTGNNTHEQEKPILDERSTQNISPGKSEHAIHKPKATPAARRMVSSHNLDINTISASGKHGEIRKKDVENHIEQRTKATPLARRIADNRNINLETIQGSGVQGRILSTDLPRELVSSTADSTMPLTGIQKVTGQRMLQSHLEIPAVSMNIEADVSDMLETRMKLNENLKVTINDFVLKATAIALKENPRLNSVFNKDEIILKSAVNIAIAVATEKGLLVPVIKNVDKMPLSGLSQQSAALVRKARDGKLLAQDMEGGTFTVSNLGMYGITAFTPIINQPQAAILGVCTVSEKIKRSGNEFQTCQSMGLSISFDHRIVDGAEAAVFLSRIRDLLENPLLIMAH